MNLRHIGIILLVIINIFGLYDVIGVDVWTAVIIGYIFTYFLMSVFLLILSYYSIKKDTGWFKKIDILGVFIGAASIIITILYFIWYFIR